MPSLSELALPELQNTGRDGEALKSYLFQLNEQLRYVLANLDEDNLNRELVRKIEESGVGTELSQTLEAIRLKASGQEDALAELTVSVNGIGATVQAQSGTISALQQTAAGLQTEVADNARNHTALSQTVEGISATAAANSGAIAELNQTAEGLSSRVQGAEGSVSTLNQRMDSLTLGVENDTDSATITLSADGIAAQSKTIKFTGDVVFKSDLAEAGRTTINGENITTGTINADLLNTGTVKGSLGYSEWNLDDGTFQSGSATGTRVKVTPDAIRWYKDNYLTGVVRSVIGSTYYTANSTYCYLGWCDNEANGFRYGGHGLHTLPWTGMWPNDGNLNISTVSEAGMAVHGEFRVPSGSVEASGHISCSGYKSREVMTSFGKEHLFAMESPTPMFLDAGGGVLDADGTCTIVLDARYGETVCGAARWWVTPTNGPGALWVERKEFGAVVHGPAGLEFDWMCSAAQAGYETWYADGELDACDEREDALCSATELAVDELLAEGEGIAKGKTGKGETEQ